MDPCDEYICCCATCGMERYDNGEPCVECGDAIVECFTVDEVGNISDEPIK